MMINATLLVQIVNFIAGYYLLRFLFLNPVSRLIEQEDDATKKQHEAINDQKEAIAQHIAIKREEWQQCQKHFRENKPTFVRALREKQVPVVTMRDVPESDITKMRETVTKLIISKVQNVS